MRVSMARTPNSLARRKSGVQIPSPPPPNLAGQSVASVERATLTACSGRAAAASSSHSPAGRLSETRGDSFLGPHHDHAAWSPPAANRRAILARIPPLPVGHLVDLAHCPTTAPRRRPSRSRPAAGPASPVQPRGPGSNLGQTRRRRGHVGRPRRHGHPSRAGCRPHCLAPRPHSRRTQRTPEAGHWSPGRSDARTGHRSLGQAPRDTGRSHRTPDRNADTVTAAQPASGPPWPPRRATAR
jgi:hypothetical protein